MADWVHCNLCFHQPGDGRKFSLTSCGHIFCDNCVLKGTKEKCVMCGSPCTTIQLTAKMKPDVEVYFTNPMELAKRNFKQLSQVMDFQGNHRQRLTGHFRETVAKQNSLSQRAQKAVDLEREILVLQEENAYLKRLIQSSKGQLSRPSPVTHGTVRHSPIADRGINNKTPYRGSGTTDLPGPGQSHITPNRLCVRTPPSGGRIGIIPNSQSPVPHARRSNTPGPYGDAHSHGKSLNMVTQSPMSASPSTQITRQIGLHHGITLPKTPTNATKPTAMFATPSRSPQKITQTPPSKSWNTSRQQIKLSYPIHSSGINARLATQNRHRVCQQKIHTLHAENANLRSQMIAQGKELKGAQDDAVNLQEKMSTCQEQLKNAQEQEETHGKLLTQAQEEIHRLKLSLENVYQGTCDPTRNNSGVQEIASSLEDFKSVHGYKGHVAHVSSELEIYTSNLSWAEEKASMKQTMALYQSQAQQARDDALKLETKCSQLEKAVEQLRKKLQEADSPESYVNPLGEYNPKVPTDFRDAQWSRKMEFSKPSNESLVHVKPLEVQGQSSASLLPSKESETLDRNAKHAVGDLLVPFHLHPHGSTATSSSVSDSQSSGEATEPDSTTMKLRGLDKPAFELQPCKDMQSIQEKLACMFNVERGPCTLDCNDLDKSVPPVPGVPGTVSPTNKESNKDQEHETNCLRTPCQRVLFKPCVSSGRKRKFTAVIQNAPSPLKNGSQASSDSNEGTDWIDDTPITARKSICGSSLKSHNSKRRKKPIKRGARPKSKACFS